MAEAMTRIVRVDAVWKNSGKLWSKKRDVENMEIRSGRTNYLVYIVGLWCLCI